MSEDKVVGWIAFYNGRKIEIERGVHAHNLYSAKLYAIRELRVPKKHHNLLAISAAY